MTSAKKECDARRSYLNEQLEDDTHKTPVRVRELQ